MSGSISQTGAARRAGEVAGLMESLTVSADAVAFDEPWQLRAFALAVAAHKSGLYEWSEFESALIASIKDWEDSDGRVGSWSYYEHWLNAVESVLGNHAVVDRGLLESRVHDVLRAPANRNHHSPHYEPVAIAPAIIRD